MNIKRLFKKNKNKNKNKITINKYGDIIRTGDKNEVYTLLSYGGTSDMYYSFRHDLRTVTNNKELNILIDNLYHLSSRCFGSSFYQILWDRGYIIPDGEDIVKKGNGTETGYATYTFTIKRVILTEKCKKLIKDYNNNNIDEFIKILEISYKMVIDKQKKLDMLDKRNRKANNLSQSRSRDYLDIK